jgi:hypothetical protein
MYTDASVSLRILYCLAVVSAVFPYGMSGWVALTLGATPRPILFMAFPLLFLVAGLWRVYRVARYPGTLGSYTFDGALKVARIVGIVGMVIAVLYLLVRLGSGPWLRSLDRSGDISTRGIASYVAGVYFAMFSGFATLGIIIFEFSRLLGFEKFANASAEDS